MCNEHWQVVALHHQGIRADGADTLHKNQGVRIERVREGLIERGVLEAERH